MSEAEEAAVALDGRTLGRRGIETRAKLLDATEARLASQGVRELRVVDIARSVGTSPATFYQYFSDVEEAVLALAEDVVVDIEPIVTEIDGDWAGDGLERARKVVGAFVRYWDTNRVVLRVRNLAAEEGDERFREARLETLRPVTAALDDQIAANQAAGAVSAEMSSYAAAAALVAMLERIGAYHLALGDKISDTEIIETSARILHATVSGTWAQ